MTPINHKRKKTPEKARASMENFDCTFMNLPALCCMMLV